MCIAEFELTTPDPPLVIQQLIEFADVISNQEFKQWYYKNRQNAPWIPYALLTIIHSIIVGFAEVANHYEHANTLADSDIMPPCSAHAELEHSFNMIKTQLTSGLKQ